MTTTESDVVGVLTFGAACWLGGFGFALYRAVGWIERMRRWAHASVEVHEKECNGC